MAITLTPAAAARVKTFLTKRGSGVGLRLGVKKTGCSGFAYTVEYADVVEQDDLAFESQGLTVVVRQEALALLDGTEVDFVREGLGESFTFRNPNAQDECGCGESFSV